jgi:small-conductance mechanosensitive channel
MELKDFHFSVFRETLTVSTASYCEEIGVNSLKGGTMSVDISIAWKTAAKILNEILSLLPNVFLGMVIFALFLVAASLAKSLTRRVMLRRLPRQGMALLFERLVHTSITFVGFLIALSIVAPSFQAADLVKVLGVGTIAIGFAFQNILQNFLAGILLLLQEPFRLGDFISVTGIEGNVSDIQARATIVTTKEGRDVIIPNATIFTNPVAVGHKDKQKS